VYPRRSLDEVHAELAEEHREIMALVSRIEARGQSEELAPLLKALHDRLADHFAHEQFPGGLYEAMGASGPEHHEDLKVLVREHCTLLSTARGLVERARSVTSAGRDALLLEVGAMIAALRAHEEREHRLASKLRAEAEASPAR